MWSGAADGSSECAPSSRVQPLSPQTSRCCRGSPLPCVLQTLNTSPCHLGLSEQQEPVKFSAQVPQRVSPTQSLSLRRPQQQTRWLDLAWLPLASSSSYITLSGSSYWYGSSLAILLAVPFMLRCLPGFCSGADVPVCPASCLVKNVRAELLLFAGTALAPSGCACAMPSIDHAAYLAALRHSDPAGATSKAQLKPHCSGGAVIDVHICSPLDTSSGSQQKET